MDDLDSKKIKLKELAGGGNMKKAVVPVAPNEPPKFYLSSTDEKTSVTLTPTGNSSESGEKLPDNASSSFGIKRLYVKNIGWDAHENMLKRFLQKFGQIKKCKIIRDDMNRSKGFGFVEFVDQAAAAKALKANKSELTLSSRVLNLEPYQDRKHTSSTSSERSQPATNSTSTKAVEREREREPEQRTIEHEPEAITTGSTTVYDLPYNVLVVIFSRLCLRDLCVVEQGLF